MRLIIYNYKALLRDVFAIRLSPRKKGGRVVWGTDPADLGEGMAFSYSGEEIFEPGKPAENYVVMFPDIDKEIRMVNAALNRVVMVNKDEEEETEEL